APGDLGAPPDHPVRRSPWWTTSAPGAARPAGPRRAPRTYRTRRPADPPGDAGAFEGDHGAGGGGPAPWSVHRRSAPPAHGGTVGREPPTPPRHARGASGLNLGAGRRAEQGPGAAGRDGHSAGGVRSSRRSSWALAATMIVDADITAAPTAIGSTKPTGASTPAASGTATRL